MTSATSDVSVPFGTKLHQTAMAMPDSTAIIFAAQDGSERIVTFGEVDDRSTKLARVLVGEGLTVGDFVAISLPNGPEHLIASFAGWKVGAVVIPMRSDLPDWERARVLTADRCPHDH